MTNLNPPTPEQPDLISVDATNPCHADTRDEAAPNAVASIEPPPTTRVVPTSGGNLNGHSMSLSGIGAVVDADRADVRGVPADGERIRMNQVAGTNAVVMETNQQHERLRASYTARRRHSFFASMNFWLECNMCHYVV